MKKTITVLLMAGVILSGCSNGGTEFEGNWTCDSGLGKLTLSIQNNGGNDYIIDHFPMIGKLNVTYSDGKLIGPKDAIFSIDKQSGKLLGMNICEMSRLD